MSSSPERLLSASRTRPPPRRGVLRRFSDCLRQSFREIALFGLLSGLTVLLLAWIFPESPLGLGAFICLAPWAAAVCIVDRAWVVHWGSWLAGWAFFLVALRWLMPVTGLGYVALAFYLAIYFPMSAWAVRTGRRVGVSPVWTLPIAWVATEFLRGWCLTGFPWLFLAHALHAQTTLIQIADFAGAYGVTFVAAMVNGLIAELAIQLCRGGPDALRGAKLRAVGMHVIATAAVVGGTIGYGVFRLREANFEDGPRVAVIQEDFPLVTAPPNGEHPYAILARCLVVAARAAQEQPDLIALPETVWSAVQNMSFLNTPRKALDEMPAGAWAFGKSAHDATGALARGDFAKLNEIIAERESLLPQRWREGLPGGRLPRIDLVAKGSAAHVLLGSVAVDVLSESVSPKQKRFNSALLYDPDGSQRPIRYDKTHLVPFGEIVPFRDAQVLGFSLHWLYTFLNRLSPFSFGGKIEYSLWPGEGYTVFTLPKAGGGTWRFGTPICYEDVMPYVARNYVWGGGERRVDFLVNITNDGWFLHSHELPQHLAISVFRAVENRVGIARAANTGISGFIDPAGRTYSLVERDGVTRGPGIVGYRVDRVKIDRRSTFYGAHGDVFAISCLLLTAALWIGGIITRWALAIWNRIAGRRAQGDPTDDGPETPQPTTSG